MTDTGVVLQGGGVILAFVGVLFQTYVEDPEDYAEKARDIQESRWNSVSNELGELFVEIQNGFPPSQYNDREIPLDVKYALFIQDSYDRGDLEDLTDTIEEFDRPRQLYQKLKRHYEQMFWSLAKSIGAGVASGVTLFIDDIGEFFVVSVFLSSFFIIFLLQAGLEFREYQSTRKDLIGQWEEDFLY